MPINQLMLVPMLLGYLVGAVGTYTLLLKLSPVVTDDSVAQLTVQDGIGQTEIIELFPSGQTADQTRAA